MPARVWGWDEGGGHRNDDNVIVYGEARCRRVVWGSGSEVKQRCMRWWGPLTR